MKTLSIVMLLAIASSAALASSTSLYVENDFFHNRDYEYTHGTKLSYADDNGMEYYLWQGIYTPKDKHTIKVQPGDRPYAGWLAFGVADQYWWRSMNQFTDFSLGVVGPSSLSQESQTTIHKAINNYVPIGWDDQLKDEPAVNLRHEVKKAFWLYESVFSAAVIPQAEANVGTVMDYVGAGGDLVFGYNPDPYARTQITPKNIDGKYSAWAFTGVRGRVVAWNMLLDGNMYHDSPSVDSEPLVGDFQWGISVGTPRASLTYTDVVRTREFKTQDKPERFGSVMLTVHF